MISGNAIQQPDGKQESARRRRRGTGYSLKDGLARQGYAFARGPDVLAALGDDLGWSLSELLGECQSLPPDPRCKDGGRLRRYGRKVALPWASLLIDRPVDTYHQSSDFNPQDGDVVRRFPELTPNLRYNELLRRLIQYDLESLPLTEEQLSNPIDVGIHIVKMIAFPGRPGVSSPPVLHKDGEPYTWVHLLERRSVEGGESVVADNAKTTICETVLSDILDTFVVDDAAVYHMVREVRVLPGHDRGWRTALLIDFTPMKAALVPPPTSVAVI